MLTKLFLMHVPTLKVSPSPLSGRNTGWGDESWKKFFFFKVGSPEKDLLLCGDVLVIHLFDIATIFRHDGLQAAVERVEGLVDVGQ